MSDSEGRRFKMFTNRIGVPPYRLPVWDVEGVTSRAARLIEEMTVNGPTDGDAGFWLEPQARELWGMVMGLVADVSNMRESVERAILDSIRSLSDLRDLDGYHAEARQHELGYLARLVGVSDEKIRGAMGE